MPPPPENPSHFAPPAQQDDLDRLEHDQHVQTDGSVLDVEQVVLQLLARIFQRVAVLVLHLRPAGNARPHHMAHAVIRNLFAEPLDKFRPLRARTHEMHVALQHAPQLRNLIQPRGAQKLAHPRDPRIVIGRPSGAGIGFRVLTHRAELVTVKILSAAGPLAAAGKAPDPENPASPPAQ